MNENIGIGVDIEGIDRFRNKDPDKDSIFLNKIFTPKELDYCYSKKNYAQHLCARFCAKEAVIKALSSFETNYIEYNRIEVLNHENGMPYITIRDYDAIEIKVTLSHTKDYAVAFVIIEASKIH